MAVTAKRLRDPILRERRLASLKQPQVAKLTALVRALCEEAGPEYSIPFFDPADGGQDAEILFQHADLSAIWLDSIYGCCLLATDRHTGEQ